MAAIEKRARVDPVASGLLTNRSKSLTVTILCLIVRVLRILVSAMVVLVPVVPIVALLILANEDGFASILGLFSQVPTFGLLLVMAIVLAGVIAAAAFVRLDDYMKTRDGTARTTLRSIETKLLNLYRASCRDLLFFKYSRSWASATNLAGAYFSFLGRLLLTLLGGTLLVLPAFLFYRQSATFPLEFRASELEGIGIRPDTFLALVAIFTVAAVECLQWVREATQKSRVQACSLVIAEGSFLLVVATRDLRDLGAPIMAHMIGQMGLGMGLYAAVVGVVLAVAWDFGQAGAACALVSISPARVLAP